MVVNALVRWMRAESEAHRRQGRWARWIGRNWARFSYGWRVEPTWLEVNDHAIPVRGLPTPFAGFRVVQLSDFHCGRQVPSAYVDEAVELAARQQGDAVALTGDFVHKGYKYVDRIARALGRLRAPCGVYAVLGNHDYSVRNAMGFRRHRHLHRAIADALANQGVRVLHNEAVAVERGNARLDLVGVDDLWSRTCDLDQAYRGLDPTVPKLLLAHNPRTLERLGDRRCDLMLSGHTHGGQIDWPGLGRVTLTRRNRRLAAGLYQAGDGHVYVNKGVGFGFRFRFGTRPEVAVFSLQPV
jgi:predicted MPP superfamily phosphohydrolase